MRLAILLAASLLTACGPRYIPVPDIPPPPTMPPALQSDCPPIPEVQGTKAQILQWGVTVSEMYGECSSKVKAGRDAWPKSSVSVPTDERKK